MCIICGFRRLYQSPLISLMDKNAMIMLHFQAYILSQVKTPTF